MKLEKYFLCIHLENIELKVELTKQQKCLYSNPAVTAVCDCEKISSRKATRIVAVTAYALGKGGQD